MFKLPLYWQIIIALLLAVMIGLLAPELVVYVSWMGDVFLRLLKMVIIPLILSSIITGVAKVGGGKSLGRIGIKTLVYYLVTSVIAILTGLFFVNVIQPGVGVDIGLQETPVGLVQAAESFGATIMNMIPTNIVSACANNEMLSIIFFSIVFGVFLTQVNQKHSDFLIKGLEGIFEVMMKITLFVIKLAPLGVFGIVTKVVAEQHNLFDLGKGLSLYVITILLALGVHVFISLPLLISVVGKAKPFKHFSNMKVVLLTAFASASSSATLPLTLETVEHKSGVSNKISSFTLPLGATVNMDGTALYECVAAMFIAQAYGLDLSFSTQLLVVATALLASIGAAGIPMAGLVMISVILSAIGLPLEGLGLILAVDLPLDMLRSATNVWSDSCGAVLIAKSEGEKTKV